MPRCRKKKWLVTGVTVMFVYACVCIYNMSTDTKDNLTFSSWSRNSKRKNTLRQRSHFLDSHLQEDLPLDDPQIEKNIVISSGGERVEQNHSQSEFKGFGKHIDYLDDRNNDELSRGEGVRNDNKLSDTNQAAEAITRGPISILEKIENSLESKSREDEVQMTRQTDHVLGQREVECCWEVSKTSVNTSRTFQVPYLKKFGLSGDPGEGGARFVFKPGELTEEESKKKEQEYKTHFFDEWISKKIAVHRSLPDDRSPQCKQQQWGPLPAVSVLVVFYNEAWTTLLRSIHSILDRTPDYLLLELILLDDFSDMEHLKSPLEAYVRPMRKVRLLRAKERLGLIRARNDVFEFARGEVVVFLDSHIECFPGWLEPLLAPIKDNFRTITFPVIEYINPQTFGLRLTTGTTHTGGLTLSSLSFNWLYNSKSPPTNTYANRRSPTMPGGLYAVSSKFFRHLGKYDPGMDFWGGENLEISFKTWMCGGSILLVGCSHVGHIFRLNNPTLRGRSLGYRNNARLAEVWMDGYKHFFYEFIFYRISPFGDVSSRVELRKSLQCQDFTWYLDNVFPELKEEMDLQGLYVGTIRHTQTNLCLERVQDKDVSLKRCQLVNVYQLWKLRTDGRLTSYDQCLELQTLHSNNQTSYRLQTVQSGADKKLSQTWSYDSSQRLVHQTTGLCLQYLTNQRQVVPVTCTASSWQTWNLMTRQEYRKYFQNKRAPIDWTI